MKTIDSLLTKIKEQSSEDKNDCLIVKFFQNEAKKGAHLRSKQCLISCRCKKCNPVML